MIGLLDLAAWGRQYRGDAWQEILTERRGASPDTLRLHTRTGRPLGTDSFLSKIETILGHRVRPLPVGRQIRLA